MIMTEQMSQYFADENVLSDYHIDEYNNALDGRESLEEHLLDDENHVIIFDTGFILFKIDGYEVEITSYYRSKDSTVPIKPVWESLKEVFRLNGCIKIVAYAINEKVCNVYERRYGFTAIGYDGKTCRYKMEQDL